MKADVYQIITDRIVSMLEQGTIPWQKNWRTGAGFPRSFASGKAYRGVNVWLLASANYASSHWMTFKQAQERGGCVRKGEKGTPVVFWKKWTTKDKATGEEKSLPVLRYYYVFNAQQIDGVEFPTVAPLNPAAADIPTCDGVVNGYADRPTINHGFARACYIPALDRVEMPHKTAFTDDQAYYATLFHELVHSTGHESRLARSGLKEVAGYGSATYAKEELVAEMGAAFLCGHSGILNRTIDNTAAYVQGWLQALRDDRKLVVHAAANAQKACDHILGTTWAPEESEATTTETAAA